MLRSVAAGAAAVLLVACGGASTPSTSPAPASATPQGSGAAKPSRSLTQIKLLLDWVTEGYQAPFYLAAAKGYYKAAGLNVEIVPGKGSVGAVEQVGHGNYPFAFANAQAVVVAVGKGIPVQMAADYFQVNPMAVISLAKSNIHKPSDLVGKTIGVVPGSALQSLLPGFLAANHLKTEQIKIVNTTPETNAALLTSGKIQGVLDFDIIVLPELKAQHIDATELRWGDWGVPALANGLVVNNDYARQHPDVVKAFVQASNNAWAYAERNQAEAIQALQQATGSVPPGAADDMSLAYSLLHTSNSQGKPLGWMSPKDWQDTLDTLHRYAGVPVKPLSDYYTNEYIAAGA